MEARSLLIIGGLMLWSPALCAGQNCAEQEKSLARLKCVTLEVVRANSLPGNPVVKLVIAGGKVRITDDMVAHLARFGNLKSLQLADAQLTTLGFQHLANLRTLTDLSLNFISIPKEGLEILQKLPNLQSLNLAGTDVTDTRLEKLTEWKTLKTLILDRDICTDRGVENLQRALPNLKIDRGNNNTADKRMRKHFGIAEEKPLTEEEVKSAIIRQLPLGSSPAAVYRFLKQRGVGAGNFSSYYPMDDEGVIICRIEYDPESGYIVQKHYCLLFRMDQQKRLKEIAVKTWFTGP